MGFPAINGNTKVCCLFGWPVEHSFSPAMHNAAYQRLSLNYTYVPFNVHPASLPQAVQAVRALGLAGVNVTVPHKQAVLPLLDQIDAAAQMIGAVNTIVNVDGKLVGYNTDGSGFVKSLIDGARFAPKNKTALILGAGGAARAVAVQLALSGLAGLYITNRTPARAAELAEHVSRTTGVQAEALPWGHDLPADIVMEVDLVVQTTSMGMSPHIDQCPDFPLTALHAGQLVCDLIYNPDQTAFLRGAAARGAATLNGLGMLLYQGVLAFELWTGQTAPVDVMREALLKQVAERRE